MTTTEPTVIPPKLAAALALAVAKARDLGPLPKDGEADKGRGGKQRYVRASDVQAVAQRVLAEVEVAPLYSSSIEWREAGTGASGAVARVQVLVHLLTLVHASGASVTLRRETPVGQDVHATETVALKYWWCRLLALEYVDNDEDQAPQANGARPSSRAAAEPRGRSNGATTPADRPRGEAPRLASDARVEAEHAATRAALAAEVGAALESTAAAHADPAAPARPAGNEAVRDKARALSARLKAVFEEHDTPAEERERCLRVWLGEEGAVRWLRGGMTGEDVDTVAANARAWVKAQTQTAGGA